MLQGAMGRVAYLAWRKALRSCGLKLFCAMTKRPSVSTAVKHVLVLWAQVRQSLSWLKGSDGLLKLRRWNFRRLSF